MPGRSKATDRPERSKSAAHKADTSRSSTARSAGDRRTDGRAGAARIGAKSAAGSAAKSATKPGAKSGRRPRSEAEKFASNKARDRQRKQRARTLKQAAIVAGGALAVGLLFWGIWAFISSPVFEVKQVEVLGISAISEADIRELIAGDVDTTLFRVSSGDLEESVGDLPWVKSVQVKKRLPSTISITIIERTPVAAVTLASGTVWVVAEDGRWLGAVASTVTSDQATSTAQGAIETPIVPSTTEGPANSDIAAIPDGGAAATIVDPKGRFKPVSYDPVSLVGVFETPNPKPSAGAKISSPEVLNAMAVLAGLDPTIIADAARVTAPEVGSTTVTTKSGVDLIIGSSDDIQVKSKVILSIMKAHAGEVSLINVRSVDNPTWRGLEGR